MPMFSLSPRVIASIAATWFVWGSTYLVIKFALIGFPPFFLMGTRFVLAGILLFAFSLWRGGQLPSVKEWVSATVIGTLMLGGGMGATAYAELTIGSGLVVAFIAISPLLITLANLPFGVKPKPLELVGIGLGMIGVLLLTQGASYRSSWSGLLAICIGCVGWTLGTVLSQRSLRLAPGTMGFASEMICGGIVLLCLSALAGEPWALNVPIGAWVAWTYLVVFGSLIAFNAYMYLISKVSSGIASSYTFVNPLIALGLGVTFGQERITSAEWRAVMVIFAGLVLLLFARRTRQLS